MGRPQGRAFDLDFGGSNGGYLQGGHLQAPASAQNHYHQLTRKPYQVASQSALMGGPRSGRAAADDNCGGGGVGGRFGSGGRGQTYELSQDLADKRIEMLERRYGGERARLAATAIQRFYRRRAIMLKFRAITATAKAHERARTGGSGEGRDRPRAPRRGQPREAEDADGEEEEQQEKEEEEEDVSERIRSDFFRLNTNINASVYGMDSRRPCRSLSLRNANRGSAGPEWSAASGPDRRPCVCRAEDCDHVKDGVVAQDHRRERTIATPPRHGQACADAGSDLASGALAGVPSPQWPRPPPSVPRRSSSIKADPEPDGSASEEAAFGSARSVLSSSSSSASSAGDERVSAPNGHPAAAGSPVWKRKASQTSAHSTSTSDSARDAEKRLAGDAAEGESEPGRISPSTSSPCETPPQQQQQQQHHHHRRIAPLAANNTYNNVKPSDEDKEACESVLCELASESVSEVARKRQYRVGLNLFNKRPERGLAYLAGHAFVDAAPRAVARFLLARKGISKQRIGEYLGDLQSPFNAAVLECFASEVDLRGLEVDVALRKFQSHFRMPGEAQKIERLMQVFASRYCFCNGEATTASLRSADTVFVLAFAVIMLNTDLHTPALASHKRMKVDEFIRNLRGVDDGCDIPRPLLEAIYARMRQTQFAPASDHVTQVAKVQETIVGGQRPVLALPHRRLVCYCRLYEVADPGRREKATLHQREVFLFNDLLVVTKILGKKKAGVTYAFRSGTPLAGLAVGARESPHFAHLLEVRRRVDGKVVIWLNARNAHDRAKFCDDLRESVHEMDDMEALRIDAERRRADGGGARKGQGGGAAHERSRDSGVADLDAAPSADGRGAPPAADAAAARLPRGEAAPLKRTPLSNSLLDMRPAGEPL